MLRACQPARRDGELDKLAYHGAITPYPSLHITIFRSITVHSWCHNATDKEIKGFSEQALMTGKLGIFCAVHESAIGTFRTSGDVRLESANWAKADIDSLLSPIGVLLRTRPS